MTLAVTPPRTGPCADWATAEDVSACGCCSGLDKLDPDILAQNLANASEILYQKSGFQWPGQCTETVRPCCDTGLLGGYSAALVEGQWYNVRGCGSPCVPYLCGMQLPRFDLGQYPVVAASVKINGAALPTTAFRIDEWRYLTRIDGSLWPPIQNLAKPDTEAGTWSVTMTYGSKPPRMGVNAASQLACELTKHCQGIECRLPLRVTAVNRQGVTYSLADVMDILDRGKTGVYFVDLFLDTVNPDKLRRPPRVLSLDRPTPRRIG